ncbi:tetratricopeptide repeat protein [Actinomadura sp. WMMA1423]|uniref:tetratricopeptide repeat protein n=1 Tax=Actinomadura sp. WMMA1423 TaxID=2591108 RepID=UPI00143D80C9|nr:tetratricopeptide repeat protein [Actinomadura sp. WMMA1423]
MGDGVNQHAVASGFARVFQAAGNLIVYEAAECYRLGCWPAQGINAPASAQVGTPTGVDAWEQPSVLLQASNALVGFTGRADERQRLLQWRDGPAGLAVRLVHGPGGQGKTRLAGQVAGEWAAQGWVVMGAYHRRDRQGPTVFQAPRLEGAAGVLVAVDYAERWDIADLLTLLHDTRISAGAGVAVRVLLLARPAGTWWQTLQYRIKHDLDLTATRTELRPLENDPAVTREGLFTAARDRFADLLKVPAAKGIAPPTALADHEDYRLVLAVHMAALATVLGHDRSGAPPADPVEVSEFLLGRERAFWQDLHARTDAPLATTPDAMAQVVYIATLAGPLSHTDAINALEWAAIESREHPGQLLKDHALCYPPPADDAAVEGITTVPRATALATRMLEPLYPDRLGEDYLALLTCGHAHDFPCDMWADNALSRLLAAPAGTEPGRSALPPSTRRPTPPVWARHALTTLIEAAARWPHLAHLQLYPLLRARPYLALEAGGTALAALASLEDADPALLEAIENLLPNRHIDLDIAAAALAKRLAEHRLAATTAPAQRARIHDVLAIRLSYAGQHDHALTQSSTALHIRRELTAAPDGAAYLPDLAMSLNNHALRLAEVGRRDEAVPISQQAVDAYRDLAATNRAAHLPDLAMSLSNHAVRLAEVGRQDEAVPISQQAVDTYRDLAATNRAAHLPDLAMSLNNHADLLAEVGRRDEAVPISQQAVKMHRDLAAANRAAHLPDLAMSLNNHALRLAEVGRRDEAVPISQQAVEMRRELAATNRAAYLPDLAASLNNHALRLAEVGRRDEAVPISQQAVDAYRDLAATNRAAHLPDLAMSLSNHAVRLAEVGRQDEAVPISQQAVEMRRELTATNRAAHIPDLAMSLSNNATLLAQVGRLEEAVSISQEALELRRGLAATNRAAYLPGLAGSLNNHALFLAKMGRRKEAVSISREAVDAYRDLAVANRAAYLPRLAGSLNNHALFLAKMGRRKEAVSISREAVDAYRDLAVANRAAYLSGYTKSLTTMGHLLVQDARWGEAVALLIKALKAGQELPEYAQGILGTIIDLLRECHAEDAAATARTYRAVTNHDVPDWLKQPPAVPKD